MPRRARRRSTGTKLFCLSGNVERPGVYEVPFGTTLRELLDLAGGVAGGRELQAVLLGGAAGGFVRPDELDLPLTFEGAREAKTTLGSGVVLVLDDTRRPAALPACASPRSSATSRAASACPAASAPCASRRRSRASSRAGRAAVSSAELALVAEIGQCMRDASICGLGQTASSAIESAIGRLGVFGGTT